MEARDVSDASSYAVGDGVSVEVGNRRYTECTGRSKLGSEVQNNTVEGRLLVAED